MGQIRRVVERVAVVGLVNGRVGCGGFFIDGLVFERNFQLVSANRHFVTNQTPMNISNNNNNIVINNIH